ncbi:hypothetical protein HanPSC8_Chr10g0424401 [Helianthus annuus]|nr:hypothetical protein HanPSC8_Chr10g0424401 [Helianthus annuus]
MENKNIFSKNVNKSPTVFYVSNVHIFQIFTTSLVSWVNLTHNQLGCLKHCIDLKMSFML